MAIPRVRDPLVKDSRETMGDHAQKLAAYSHTVTTGSRDNIQSVTGAHKPGTCHRAAEDIKLRELENQEE